MAERRLIDTSDLPLERALLGAASAETTPAEVRHRALSALGLLGIAPMAGTVAATTADTAARATGKALLWKTWFAKAALVITLGGTGLAFGWSDSTSPHAPSDVGVPKSEGEPAKGEALGASVRGPTTVSPDSRAVTARTTDEEPAAIESAPPRTVAGVRTKAVVAPSPTKPAKFSIREEIDLLDRARNELARGDRTAARQLVDEYLKRFPQGELRNEARLIRRGALGAE